MASQSSELFCKALNLFCNEPDLLLRNLISLHGSLNLLCDTRLELIRVFTVLQHDALEICSPRSFSKFQSDSKERQSVSTELRFFFRGDSNLIRGATNLLHVAPK